MKLLNLTNQVFGRLTVISLRDEREHGGGAVWLCRCECGNEVYVRTRHLREGSVVSCGCYHREVTGEVGKATRTHGHSINYKSSPELQAYSQARYRCNNPNCPFYADYGGRGIKFLFESFEEFYAELGPRPPGVSPGGRALYSLNRINNDGNYEPGNVEWADQSTQLRNRRRNTAH